MPTLARPDVDLLDGLTTAIIVDQERLGANPRSTLGTVTDAHAMLRSLFSRLGQPHIGGPTAFSFNIPTTRASGVMTGPNGERRIVRDAVYLGGMCRRVRGPRHGLRPRPGRDHRRVEVARRGRHPRARVHGGRLDGRDLHRVRLLRPEKADQGLLGQGAPRPAVQADGQDQGQGDQRRLRRIDPEDPEVDLQQGRRRAAAPPQGIRRAGRGLQDLSGLWWQPAQRGGALLEDQRPQHRRRVRPAGHRRGRVAARNRRQGRGAARRQPAPPPRRVRRDRPWLPLARPALGHVVRRRGAAHQDGPPHRVRADRRHLRLRRAHHRPAPARHPADERPAPRAARQGQHRARRRAQARDHRDRRPRRRPRARGRARVAAPSASRAPSRA